jgi:hypothetical protein
MNVASCPMKTSSSIVTLSQMNVWLWILQFAPNDRNPNSRIVGGDAENVVEQWVAEPVVGGA